VKKFALFLFTIVATLAGLNTIASDDLLSPVPEDTSFLQTKLEFGAWVANWDEDLAIDSLNTNTQLKSISPVWFKLTPDAYLTTNTQLRQEEITGIALDKKFLLIPSITNNLDPDRVIKLLTSEERKTNFIQSIGDIVALDMYAGVDLDFEMIEEKQKINFSLLIADVSQAVHKKGKLLAVTVHAKTGENDWQGSLGQDWDQIALYADEIRIMAYDYHNSQTPPGSISPITYIAKVVDFALNNIPKEKITIGLPLYGYDWTEGSVVPIRHIDISAAGILDKETYSKHYSDTASGNSHEVWFEDRETLEQKIKLVRSRGLTKFYFWRLGGEDSKIWEID